MVQAYRSLTTLCGTAILLTGLCGAAGGQERKLLTRERLDCLIEASATLKLGAAVPGLIQEVHVDRGDIVRQGQLVAELESEVEQANLAAAKSKAANDNPIHSGRARLDFLNRKFKRMETLRTTNAVSEATFDEARTDERVAVLTLKEAELNHDIAQSETRRAEGLLRQRRIVSPVDGVVVERALGSGEYRHEQAHILVIARINPLYVEVFVPIAFFGQTQVGALAEIEPEAPVGGRYTATVTVVDSMLDAASGTFGVRLTLANPDLRLPGGLRCKIQFLERASGRSANPG